MKLFQALKLKNRLVGEVQRLQEILQRENARRSDSVSTIDRERMFASLVETQLKLSNVKSAIAIANVNIYGKINLISEYKSFINFLKSLTIRETQEVLFVGRDQEKLVYNWDSFITTEKRDEHIVNIQNLISNLQDEIDNYNAVTDVNI